MIRDRERDRDERAYSQIDPIQNDFRQKIVFLREKKETNFDRNSSVI